MRQPSPCPWSHPRSRKSLFPDVLNGLDHFINKKNGCGIVGSRRLTTQQTPPPGLRPHTSHGPIGGTTRPAPGLYKARVEAGVVSLVGGSATATPNRVSRVPQDLHWSSPQTVCGSSAPMPRETPETGEDGSLQFADHLSQIVDRQSTRQQDTLVEECRQQEAQMQQQAAEFRSIITTSNERLAATMAAAITRALETPRQRLPRRQHYHRFRGPAGGATVLLKASFYERAKNPCLVLPPYFLNEDVVRANHTSLRFIYIK